MNNEVLGQWTVPEFEFPQTVIAIASYGRTLAAGHMRLSVLPSLVMLLTTSPM